MTPVSRMILIFALVLATLPGQAWLLRRLQIEDNGYDGMVVAIHKSVTQDNSVIDNIKSIITRASSYQYEATEHRTFFRNVTILVPDTWTPDATWSADTDDLTFKEADVRVDHPHPLFGIDPYVFQPGQCGEQGKYIHFTPYFILDPDNKIQQNFGETGRTFVHEFAHYRYGIFDEYGIGNANHPKWYLDGTRARPSGCAKGVAGFSTGSCSPGPDGLPTASCSFVPDINPGANTITASIMSYPFLDSVTKFCKSSTDPSETHNFFAPNQHNKMCKKEATYDVIMDHEDFRLGNAPRDGLDVTPSFKVVQAKKQVSSTGERFCGRRVVLTIDVSGSMAKRSYQQQQVSDRLIRDILPLGTDLGIVSYSDIARVLANMTTISDNNDRETLSARIPNTTGGGTAIGRGLLQAIELLQRNGKSSQGGHIILITDGKENQKPLVNDALPEIVDAGVIVHSIAFGTAAAQVLSQVTRITGGRYAYFSESGASTALDEAMAGLLEELSSCDEEDNSVEIDRKGIPIKQSNNPYVSHVTIDGTIGKDTLFSFTIARNSNMTIRIIDPAGTVYDQSSPEYSFNSNLNIVRFRVPLAQSGVWTYTITSNSVSSSSQELVIFVVKSNARVSGQSPIVADTWMSDVSVDLRNSTAIVYTHVHRGYDPVIGASVLVTVDRAPDPPVWFFLKDDGMLPDNRAGDGVYTAAFVEPSGNQRYSMQIRVSSVWGQTFLVTSGSSSGAPSIYQNTTTPPVHEPVENFTRTSSPGAVDISGYDPDLDLFPPGTVSDLKVVTFDRDYFTVTLTWTAPGDDYTNGTVDRYELRVGGTFSDIQYQFSSSLLIVDADLKEGTLDPLPAGSQQQVVITLATDWPHDSYVFGLMAFDETNRTSDLSNFQSVTFKEITYPPPETPAPTNPRLSLLTIIIIAAAAAAVLLLIVIVVIVVIVKSKRAPKVEKADMRP